MASPSKRILLLVCLAGALPTASVAQDRALVVPGMKVLLNNDCARVQYHDVAVGQTARCIRTRRTSSTRSGHSKP